MRPATELFQPAIKAGNAAAVKARLPDAIIQKRFVYDEPQNV
jgi:hypothetical protein